MASPLVKPPDADPEPRVPSMVVQRLPALARALVASGAAALVCWLIWSQRPRSLTGPVDIVGYPSFHAFNFHPPFWLYRLTVYVFPIVAVAGYLLLRRLGPLRERGTPAHRRRPVLAEPITEPQEAHLGWASVVVRAAVPAGVVVAAASTGPGGLGVTAALAGVGYAALIGLAALGWAWYDARGRPGGLGPSVPGALAYLNGLGGAAAALLGLWFVSEHTAVLASGERVAEPWFPLGLALVGVGISAAWTIRQIRAGRPAWDVERLLLVVVVGSAAVFLAVSQVRGEIAWFQGYDDAMETAGSVLLGKGYFPWRDMLFIHGLFPDVLAGTIGSAIFGDTLWGISNAVAVVLAPLCWVFTYLFFVWVSRANMAFALLAGAVIASGVLPAPVGPRFILVPVALVVLGETLRRRTWPWAAGLMMLLFLQAVLVPETGFLVVPAMLVVLASDVVHRPRRATLLRELVLTRRCLVLGAAGMAVFAAFLATQSALRPFLDYYVVFGPGHNESGAIPPTALTAREHVMLGLGVAAVLATVLASVRRLLRRRDWEARDWMVVAAAGFVALYHEKALGRLDPAHVWQVFGISVLLVGYWVWRVLASADHLRGRLGGIGGLARLPYRFASVATAGALAVALVALAPGIARSLGTVDTRFQTTVTAADPAYARLGYATPDAIDPTMLRDLDVALDTYAGRDGAVFDMTNALGYYYYLLDREPGTRFLHVSMAVPAYSQEILIDELSHSRPPVVVFDSAHIGLPGWDAISSAVRHYMVSAYVLDAYAPVLRTHGNLIMLRRDLLPAVPAVPDQIVPPQVDDLYFSGRGCDWGAAGNYLTSRPSGPEIHVPVAPRGQRLLLDIGGWAVDPATGAAAREVVVVSGGDVIAAVEPAVPRPDLPAVLGPGSGTAGFQITGLFDIPVGGTVGVYQLNSDGLLHPLLDAAGMAGQSVELADGRQVGVATTPAGHVERFVAQPWRIGELQVPAGVRPADYDLARFRTSAAPAEPFRLELTDAPGMISHTIASQWLPMAGAELSLRVGSCLEWHGYPTPDEPLYVLQSGGPAITSVTLSAVTDG